MKVKDLLKMQIDIDVYDNVCEELGIAFCGATKLTNKGKKKLADALEYDIILDGHSNVAIIDIDFPDWEDRLEKAKELFYSLAGYCDDCDYDEWFKEL